MGYRFLEDGEISIHDDRWLTYPWGVNGAEPGQRSTKEIVRADGTSEFLPSKCDLVPVSSGDILYFNTWGGGGVGNPLTREPERVLHDVRSGLVSAQAAKDAYGVVVDGESLDLDATSALRESKAVAEATGSKVFNFGGDLEELRSRCLNETGLVPPTAPDFSRYNYSYKN